MSPVTRRTVHSAGVDLAVFEQGDPAAPTVLLVHGYPDTHRVWDDVAEDLAADHHVVRYDVRGAGESSVPAGRAEYRLELLAADLFAVADAVSPDRPVHVVAHDWGSLQSWEAVTEPGAERRLASYTTMSGPCLDHMGHWIRYRLRRPTPGTCANSWSRARTPGTSPPSTCPSWLPPAGGWAWPGPGRGCCAIWRACGHGPGIPSRRSVRMPCAGSSCTGRTCARRCATRASGTPRSRCS